MTTPAHREPMRPASPVTDYTHRKWLYEMAIACGHAAGITTDLGRMETDLDQVKAGRTHRRLLAENLATGRELVEFGLTIMVNTDNRYMPVFEKIQQAGGLDEVAQDKHYHDRT